MEVRVVGQSQDWGMGFVNSLSRIFSVYGNSSPPSSSLLAGEDESDEWKSKFDMAFVGSGYPVSEKDVEFFWVGGIPVG